ncbi:MFS transporter [Nocardioides sp. LHD-245]|uniref:MFS transporter n=1 Tax=Nocardioides sp. LHD-245 TaxID=3051387 RepID=UPI0027E13207|nr:MFS transporter [Nocardioides sp. LHD-245]
MWTTTARTPSSPRSTGPIPLSSPSRPASAELTTPPLPYEPAPEPTPESSPVASSQAIALVLGVIIGLSGTGSAATAVALPELAADVGFDPDRGVWVLTAYALTLAVTTALYGRVADRSGVRGPLTLGVALLSLGALLAVLAPSFELLIAARLLQGCGAGAAPVVTLAALRAVYPPQAMPRALATWAASGVVFTAAGPVLGGLATQLFGWRAAVLVPALAALALAPIRQRLPTGGSGGRLDYLGALWVVAAAAGLVLLVQSASLGPAATGAGVALLALALPLVARQIRRRPDGFVPRAAIREPVVLRNSIAGSVIHGSWYGLIVTIPTFLAARGWDPIPIGLAMLPGALLGAFCGRIVAYAIDRLGGTRSMSASALLCFGALTLAAIGCATGAVPLLVVAMAVVYLAMTLGQPALGASVVAAVPAATTGIAIGVSTLLFLNGGGIGSAIAGLAPVLGPAGALGLLAGLCLASSVFLAQAARTGQGLTKHQPPGQVRPSDC